MVTEDETVFSGAFMDRKYCMRQRCSEFVKETSIAHCWLAPLPKKVK